MDTRALILGGGGVTGIAWEIGVITALSRAGVDLSDADIVVGTSAGSVVGALCTGPRPIQQWYDGQLGPADAEIGAAFGPLTWLRMAWPMVLPGAPVTKRRRAAAAGLRRLRRHPELAGRRAEVIGSRLGASDWPDADLRVVAVEAATGRTRVFTHNSGVDLVRAVAASCAVPQVWPAVEIAGHHYVDGGIRSVANADLAPEADRAVVLAPLAQPYPKYHTLPRQLERAGVTHSAVVEPDGTARSEMGRNPLDPSVRAAAARTGLRQGALAAAEVRRAWQD